MTGSDPIEMAHAIMAEAEVWEDDLSTQRAIEAFAAEFRAELLDLREYQLRGVEQWLSQLKTSGVSGDIAARVAVLESLRTAAIITICRIAKETRSELKPAVFALAAFSVLEAMADLNPETLTTEQEGVGDVL